MFSTHAPEINQTITINQAKNIIFSIYPPAGYTKDMKTKGTAHDIGAGMARISLTLSANEKQTLETLADESALSLNAYLNAIIQEIIESRPLVIMRREIIRENRPKYGEKPHDKKE